MVERIDKMSNVADNKTPEQTARDTLELTRQLAQAKARVEALEAELAGRVAK